MYLHILLFSEYFTEYPSVKLRYSFWYMPYIMVTSTEHDKKNQFRFKRNQEHIIVSFLSIIRYSIKYSEFYIYIFSVYFSQETNLSCYFILRLITHCIINLSNFILIIFYFSPSVIITITVTIGIYYIFNTFCLN